MDKLLRLLIVEDNADDAILVVRALERGGFKLQWHRIETAETMYKDLKEGNFDFIISDYRLPNFSAPEAIRMRDRLAPETPLIVVSGTIGEETAADTMVAGAQDYVMKSNLTRLVSAVERELREVTVRRKRREVEATLKQTREQYSNLIENTHDMIQSADASGKFLFVNESWLKTLGYTSGDLPGLNLANVVHSDSMAQCHAIITMVKTGIHPKGFEIKLVAKDGREILVRGNTVGYYVDGNFVSTLTIFHDVTELKKNEERILHLNSVLGIIRDINQLIVSESNEGQLVEKVCARMVREGTDYGATWISLYDKDGVMRLAANAGAKVEGCVERVMEKTNGGNSPLVRHKCHLGRFAAGISLPLRIEGHIIGILNACLANPPALTEEEYDLMLELAGDLALGIEKIRKREELRQRNIFIETILDNLPIGLSVNRVSDGAMVYMNRKFEETYGWSREIFRGVDSFFDHVYPDPKYRQQLKDRVLGDIASGDPTRMRWESIQITTQGGEHRYISAANIPLLDQGLMISTVWDVTPRHKAQEEAALKAQLLDSATDSILLADTSGQIIYANENTYVSRGYTREELMGMNLRDVRTVEQAADVENRINQILNEGKAFFETSHRRKDGSVFPVEVSARVIESGGRKLILSVTRDITDRRKMENQLVVTDRLASIGELAAGIAHEINNPLTSIIGFAELLREKEISSDIKEDVEVIYQEAMRCAEIIRNLLTFARQHSPHRESLDINAVVEKVLLLRAYEQRINNIEVVTNFAANLPQVSGDFFRLQQCFLNIVINAEYFMRQAHGGGKLSVNTELDNAYVRITFTDDGPGIPAEALARIFDPFFTTKEVGKGTGLGLSISYGLITDHGGKIRAENAPGGGASFIIELPLEPPVDTGSVFIE